MDSAVEAALPSFLRRCGEGYFNRPYLDVKGLPTIGVGILLDRSIALGGSLGWTWAPTGALASYLQVLAAWQGLLAQPKGKGGGWYQDKVLISLSDEELAKLFAGKADTFEKSALNPRRFPNFLSAPPNCQLGLMRMMWAMGGAFVDPDQDHPNGKWPIFHHAFLAEEWETCGDECRMDETRQPSEFVKANDLLQWLFWNAGPTLTLPLVTPPGA